MTPWWLALMGGLLGSSHCVGMCGGFAALVGMQTRSVAGNLRAQLIFSLGRMMTYGLFGAVAGFAGRKLAASVPQMINVPAILCLAAGLFLLWEGLLASGLIRRSVGGASAAGCLLRPLFTTLLKTPGARNSFVAGIATGFMPCGLVYAFVSLAASSGDLLTGLSLMLAFGAGTVPLMVITGCGASLLSWTARQRVWQVAAWSVMITGLLTFGRGVAYLQASPEQKTTACPLCTTNSSPATDIKKDSEPAMSSSHQPASAEEKN